MQTTFEQLGRIKKAFEKELENNTIPVDVDYPFYNVYEWKNRRGDGQILFSKPYKFFNEAKEFADFQFYQYPKTVHSIQNDIQYIFTFSSEKHFQNSVNRK